MRATSSANGIGGRTATPRPGVVRPVIPKFRTTGHLISSPIVTKVMASCRPMSFPASDADNRCLMIEDATSVSRPISVPCPVT